MSNAAKSVLHCLQKKIMPSYTDILKTEKQHHLDEREKSMKLVTAEQMRGLDNAAINLYSVPSLELMENAGKGTADERR